MADRKRRKPPEPDAAWLETLEARVREAAARLGELREENRALEARVEELEAAAGGASPAGAEPGREDAGEWRRERREIRRRVERLTETLEDLLA